MDFKSEREPVESLVYILSCKLRPNHRSNHLGIGETMNSLLFTPDNIRACMDDRKNQTRRLEASLKEINVNPDKAEYKECVGDGFRFDLYTTNQFPCNYPLPRLVKSRLHVGETAYIKEAWCVPANFDDYAPRDIDPITPVWYLLDGPINGIDGKVRSPLFMPEWAARLFRKITEVRCQRLQEISPEDCIAEGIPSDEKNCPPLAWYQALWDSINTKPGTRWTDNPWIIAYSFVEVSKP